MSSKYDYIQVGDVLETKYSGDVEVVSLSGTRKFFVKFLDTGTIIQVTGKALTSGLAREWIVPIRDSIGMVFETPSLGNFKVLKYEDCKSVTIRFENTGYITKYSASQIKSGDLKDPLAPSMFGVGYLGVGEYSHTNNKVAYFRWAHMLRRCTSDDLSLFRTYQDKEVHERWHNFQNFAEWAERQPGFYVTDPVWQLDKDLLVKGNKVYGPDTCCFIPARLNTMIGRSDDVQGYFDSKNNDYGFGYNDTDGTNYKRRFKNQEEGKLWYKENRERVTKEVADQYKNVLDSRVYKALYLWQVN